MNENQDFSMKSFAVSVMNNAKVYEKYDHKKVISSYEEKIVSLKRD